VGERDDQSTPKAEDTPSGFGAVFRAARRRSASIPQIVQRRIDGQRPDPPPACPPPDEPDTR
jgi:hypothetical protein